MEKIYMNSEDKKKKKPSFLKKLFNDKGSMVVLVVLAVVGSVGLLVFGLDQISFATEPSGRLSDEFEGKVGPRSQGSGGEVSVPITSYYADIDGDGTGTGVPIFCIEYGVDFGDGQTYDVGREITDYGLIYLMSQLYPNVSFKDSSGNDLDKRAQMWLTQAAIWSYLYRSEIADGYDDGPNSSFGGKYESVINADELDTSDGEKLIYAEDFASGDTLFEVLNIDDLITTALELHGSTIDPLRIVKDSENISVTNDNKYYQSGLISVSSVIPEGSPIISYEGYSVVFENAPEGTILVDEEGNKYENITDLDVGAKFYVRVPVDKVTDSNKNLEFSINGKYRMYGGITFESSVSDGSGGIIDYQKVAHVMPMTKAISKGLNISLDYTPSVPDTGMGVAQTIYFIGLILLLSGVGVIYAYAKPKTSN